jgi:Tat protein secretion system quality control protein TatD with DNase activity
VVKTLALLAELRGLPFDDAAAATTANARRVFGLA